MYNIYCIHIQFVCLYLYRNSTATIVLFVQVLTLKTPFLGCLFVDQILQSNDQRSDPELHGDGSRLLPEKDHSFRKNQQGQAETMVHDWLLETGSASLTISSSPVDGLRSVHTSLQVGVWRLEKCFGDGGLGSLALGFIAPPEKAAQAAGNYAQGAPRFEAEAETN